MNRLAIAAFLAIVGVAAVPATSRAMTPTPEISSGAGLVQNIDAGCARGYYRSYGRCVPNSRGYRIPRYYAPRYYDEAPRYYYRPRYYHRPRYYEAPEYY